jgi:hypothetical protein
MYGARLIVVCGHFYMIIEQYKASRITPPPPFAFMKVVFTPPATGATRQHCKCHKLL